MNYLEIASEITKKHFAEPAAHRLLRESILNVLSASAKDDSTVWEVSERLMTVIKDKFKVELKP